MRRGMQSRACVQCVMFALRKHNTNPQRNGTERNERNERTARARTSVHKSVRVQVCRVECTYVREYMCDSRECGEVRGPLADTHTQKTATAAAAQTHMQSKPNRLCACVSCMRVHHSPTQTHTDIQYYIHTLLSQRHTF